eukprot:Nitzschia sp. Nitz4//scaffold3_size479765//8991//9705//NITZ4_000006-RA/size479765-augustus-gene-0.0-mRNA-1//1//CDS//3329550476//2877//frame0
MSEDLEGSKSHVHFDAIDAEEEEERSARGQQHRKDLVRGIKWHMENEKTIRDEQMKGGYDWLKDLVQPSGFSELSVGLRLTAHGFLAFYQQEISEGAEASEELDSLFQFFLANPKDLEELSHGLQEHLVLLSLIVFGKHGGLVIEGEEDAEVKGPGPRRELRKSLSDTP